MDSRYIPMTEADCRQTCATLRQMLTSRTKEITELKEKNADLLSKVSEQEKEIERLHDLMGVEHCPSLPTCYAESKELDRLREREKELVEALRGRYEHLKWLKEVNTTPPAIIDEINFLQSLLSKFEVPNQS